MTKCKETEPRSGTFNCMLLFIKVIDTVLKIYMSSVVSSRKLSEKSKKIKIKILVGQAILKLSILLGLLKF